MQNLAPAASQSGLSSDMPQQPKVQVKAFHGTPSGGFDQFQEPGKKAGIYFTSEKNIAQEYTRERGLWLSPGKNPQVVEASLKMSNPLEIDALGTRNNNIPFPGKEFKPTVFGRVPKDAISVDDAARLAFKQGYDGLIVSNVKDSVYPDTRKNSTVYVVKSPSQVEILKPEQQQLSPKTLQFDMPSGMTPKQALAEADRTQAEMNLAGKLLREKARQGGKTGGVSKAALERELRNLMVRKQVLEKQAGEAQ